jgi:hypothetical protein
MHEFGEIISLVSIFVAGKQMIGLDDATICIEFMNVKDTFTYNPHFEQRSHEITKTFWLPKKSLAELKVSEYH